MRGNCTNWGIGRPARQELWERGIAPDCTNWGIGRPARLFPDAETPVRNCTNWGIGRPARLSCVHTAIQMDCTNWGIGRPARPVIALRLQEVYCTNWGIGRPARQSRLRCCQRAHCTNWGIGRPARLRAGKALLAFPLHRLRNRIIRLARKSAFRWKERLSGDSKVFLNAQIRRPLEGKIEHLRRDADAAHLRLPVERLFARQQIAKTPLVENLIGSVCITNSLARFCR